MAEQTRIVLDLGLKGSRHRPIRDFPFSTCPCVYVRLVLVSALLSAGRQDACSS